MPSGKRTTNAIIIDSLKSKIFSSIGVFLWLSGLSFFSLKKTKDEGIAVPSFLHKHIEFFVVPLINKFLGKGMPMPVSSRGIPILGYDIEKRSIFL